MSHFSRIKTSISNLNILQKTIKDLGFQYVPKNTNIQDANGNSQYVDFIVQKDSKYICGFLWDGREYNLVSDLQFWQEQISSERFMEKILQQYALNSIVKESNSQGFAQMNKELFKDGSIKLTMQRWS